MQRGARKVHPLVWVGLSYALFSFLHYVVYPLLEESAVAPAVSLKVPGTRLSAPVSSQVSASSQASLRAQLDEDPIHIIHAYCSGYGKVDEADNGLTVMRSILMARENGVSANRRYVFHVVTDGVVGRAWHETLNATRKWEPGEYPDRDTFIRKWGDVFRYINGTKGRVTVRHYRWEQLDAAVQTAFGDKTNTLDNRGFKHCSSVRLKMPFVLGPDVHQAIYLDNDAIVMCDIERLWDTFSTWGPKTVFGCAHEGPHEEFLTDYVSDDKKLPVSPHFHHGLNAGLLLMSLERLREPGVLREYWDEVELTIREGGYRALRLGNHSHGLVYYDQDILNILAYDKPDWIIPVSTKFNWRVWSSYGARWAERLPGSLETRYQPPTPCIEHFSAAGMWLEHGPATARSNIWRYFHNGLDLRPL